MLQNQNSDRKNSNSSLEISSNVQQQIMLIMQKDKDDLTLYGSPAPTRLNRSATVKRAATLTKLLPDSVTPTAEDDNCNSNSTSKLETSSADSSHSSAGERYRKSLDSTYRRSLESISEYKTKHSFSSACLFPSRDTTSIESTTSDSTDYALRSSTDATATKEKASDRTIVSASSSYLSWIESVNSEYFGSANSAGDTIDIDSKVGEWNNFWLNYNSTNNRYLSSPFLYSSIDEKTLEDLSDCKSTCSTQREYVEKQTYLDQYFLSHDEIMETIRCTQRITEILQNALKRNENDFDESRHDSYYSQMFPSLFSHFRKTEETPKERVRSYSLEPQELQKQKQMLKPPTQGGSSCINVLLNNGVTEILRKVISRRREVITPDDSTTTSRNSFSEWSSAK